MNIETLEKKLKPFIENLGYELYDLSFKKKKKQSILTVYIDHIDGITIDDCVTVTEQLNPYIDELDPIQEEYFLEVSSAGAEKELKTEEAILRAVDHFVHLEVHEEKVEGTLLSFKDGILELQIGKKTKTYQYEDVNLIRLAIKF